MPILQLDQGRIPLALVQFRGTLVDMALSSSRLWGPHPRHSARPSSPSGDPRPAPMRRPGVFASGRIDAAENVLVRVRSERPLRPGRGAGTAVHLRRRSGVDRRRGPRRARAAVDRPQRAAERVALRAAAVRGADRVARGALDVALWDIAGLLLGQPHAAAARRLRDRCPRRAHGLFADPARWPRRPSRRTTLRRHDLRGQGGREPALDVAAVAAVRDALPDAELYVDANRGWRVEQALAAIPRLVDLGVRAIEEPIDVHDTEGRRRVAAASPVPLAGDESCTSLEAVAAARTRARSGRSASRPPARAPPSPPDRRVLHRQRARRGHRVAVRGRDGRSPSSRSPPRSGDRRAAGRGDGLQPTSRPTWVAEGAADRGRIRRRFGRARARPGRGRGSRRAITGWTADVVHGRDGCALPPDMDPAKATS